MQIVVLHQHLRTSTQLSSERFPRSLFNRQTVLRLPVRSTDYFLLLRCQLLTTLSGLAASRSAWIITHYKTIYRQSQNGEEETGTRIFRDHGGCG